MSTVKPWSIPGAEGEVILGDCHLPAGEARGVIIIAHGLKGYKDYGMFPVIARACAAGGLIAHRFNFSHSGMTNALETFARPDLFERDTWNRQVHDCRAVVEAAGRRAVVKVSYAQEEEHRVAYNRRFWMKDGTVGWNPGKRNPNTIRPAGPIDPEVGVVYFAALDGSPKVTYVNFAMHTDTTGGHKVSADYPGALARCLATYRGPDMVTLFGNGACGNRSHHRRFLGVSWDIDSLHVGDSENSNSQKDIHEWPGNGHKESVPFRMR